MQKSYSKYSSNRVVYTSTGAFDRNQPRINSTPRPIDWIVVLAVAAVVVTFLIWAGI